ncbi:hypothetical protein FLA_4047 [Filimonas lacunae]|nr:hypothetical protein FLA_4047 [Filimonas lacunae]
MEIYYAENVEMQDNELAPRVGKTNCITVEQNNLSKLKDIHCKLLSQAVNEETLVVLSEWENTYTYKDNRVFILRTVSVQHWNSKGLVIKEKYYYKEFIKG